jgi:short-subunit dehydrogenase
MASLLDSILDSLPAEPRPARSLHPGLPLLAAAGAAYLVSRAVRARRDRLAGKVVLITGGSRGLGQLLAREFGDRGCRLVICARDADELDRARLNLERRGLEVLARPCDVSDRVEVARLMLDIQRRFGGLDVVVNNASITQVGPLASLDIEDFQRAMQINFWGTVNVTLAALPLLKLAERGRLVNICSIGSKVAVPHLLPYDCAKFAVLGFSEGLRAELAGQGISVTAVIPGLMRTGSYASATFKGESEGEFEWFSTLAMSRATAMDARQAARRIVAAAERRQPELILGWQAKLAARMKGLFPGLTMRGLAAMNWLLPKAPPPAEPAREVRGRELAEVLPRGG